jgi:hypothetical protein
MLELQLFRLKVTRPGQPTVWADVNWDTAAIIRQAIEHAPAKEVRRGFVWHIGNVSVIDESGLYFRFGRTTRASFPFFDEKTRSFVEHEHENAPYTHVFVDVQLGVCAIARNTELAQRTTAIARQLERLLNDTPVRYDTGALFALDEIKDPTQFLEQLREALTVLSFSLTFTRPNPFDVNEDFQRPMENLLQQADATAGRTTIKGDDLERPVLEELTRSAAATGNNAEAKLVRVGDERPVRRQLRENNAAVSFSDIETEEQRIDVLRVIRQAYLRIRQNLSE